MKKCISPQHITYEVPAKAAITVRLKDLLIRTDVPIGSDAETNFLLQIWRDSFLISRRKAVTPEKPLREVKQHTERAENFNIPHWHAVKPLNKIPSR